MTAVGRGQLRERTYNVARLPRMQPAPRKNLSVDQGAPLENDATAAQVTMKGAKQATTDVRMPNAIRLGSARLRNVGAAVRTMALVR